MEPALYTIGHSNRSIEAFLALLRSAGIELLADVRAMPRSRRNPHFSREALAQALLEAGMAYRWMGEALGGHRPPQPDSAHLALDAGAFRGFADHMETAAFHAAGQVLLGHASAGTPLAIMCAERRPEDCHRSFISDWLTSRGVRVVHLVDAGAPAVHTLNPLARVSGDKLIYDAGSQQPLAL